MKSKQNIDYGHNIQKVYLEMMLTDSETFVRCHSIFNPENFDQSLKKAASFIDEYVTKYNALPTFEMVNASSKQQLVNPGRLQDEHYDWLLQEFETFTRHKSLERAILKGTEMIESGQYGAIEDEIKAAVQISLQKDLGTNYWENPKDRLEAIKDKNGQMSTGWKDFDDKLFGGLNRGELVIFAGGSGSGKSLCLANLGVNYALRGMNVMYITFELSEALVGMRVDSMVTGVGTREIFKEIDKVDTKVRIIGKKSGEFQIKYMPTGKNANDLRAYIKEYEIKTGKKLDVVLVDYLDLMMPIGKSISAENLFVKDKYVSEELRNLAMEKNVIMISASQLNRSSVDEVDFDHSHISGGISKINTADVVVGIFTSRSMRERGRYQLQFMKTRNSGGVFSKVELKFDIDSLRISDLDSDDVPTPSTSEILKNITRSPKPTEQAETKNPADLRSFITKLSD